ncbi:hypothetical protein QJQ45_019935 [Haematococcus lacustris]|nr:hypothetical protein QJQ45_019935 [Haematococcus lacustris]
MILMRSSSPSLPSLTLHAQPRTADGNSSPSEEVLTDLLLAVELQHVKVLVGELLLDVLPALLPLGQASPRASGLLLPALLAQLVPAARPREALLALQEAMSYVTEYDDPLLSLLLVPLLQHLTGVLSSLPRQRLSSTLAALPDLLAAVHHLSTTCISASMAAARQPASQRATGTGATSDATAVGNRKVAARAAGALEGEVSGAGFWRGREAAAAASYHEVLRPSLSKTEASEAAPSLPNACNLLIQPVLEAVASLWANVLQPELLAVTQALPAASCPANTPPPALLRAGGGTAAQPASTPALAGAAGQFSSFCLQLVVLLFGPLGPEHLKAAEVQAAVRQLQALLACVVACMPWQLAGSSVALGPGKLSWSRLVQLAESLPLDAEPGCGSSSDGKGSGSSDCEEEGSSCGEGEEDWEGGEAGNRKGYENTAAQQIDQQHGSHSQQASVAAGDGARSNLGRRQQQQLAGRRAGAACLVAATLVAAPTLPAPSPGLACLTPPAMATPADDSAGPQHPVSPEGNWALGCDPPDDPLEVMEQPLSLCLALLTLPPAAAQCAGKLALWLLTWAEQSGCGAVVETAWHLLASASRSGTAAGSAVRAAKAADVATAVVGAAEAVGSSSSTAVGAAKAVGAVGAAKAASAGEGSGGKTPSSPEPAACPTTASKACSGDDPEPVQGHGPASCQPPISLGRPAAGPLMPGIVQNGRAFARPLHFIQPQLRQAVQAAHHAWTCKPAEYEASGMAALVPDLPALTPAEEQAVHSLAASLRRVCISVVHSQQEAHRSQAFRALQLSLSAMPPAPQAALLGLLLCEPSAELAALLMQRARQEVAAARPEAMVPAGRSRASAGSNVWCTPFPLTLACLQLVRAVQGSFDTATDSRNAQGGGAAQAWVALAGSPVCCEAASSALSLLRLMLLRRRAAQRRWPWQADGSDDEVHSTWTAGAQCCLTVLRQDVLHTLLTMLAKDCPAPADPAHSAADVSEAVLQYTALLRLQEATEAVLELLPEDDFGSAESR